MAITIIGLDNVSHIFEPEDRVGQLYGLFNSHLEGNLSFIQNGGSSLRITITNSQRSSRIGDIFSDNCTYVYIPDQNSY